MPLLDNLQGSPSERVDQPTLGNLHISIAEKKLFYRVLTIYQQRSFLLLCKILCHYKSLTPSKSMPKKSNHDFKGKYPYFGRVHSNPCTLETFSPKPFFCQNIFDTHGFNCTHMYMRTFSLNPLIWNISKTYNDIKFCKEAKTIIVVDMWLNSLRQKLALTRKSQLWLYFRKCVRNQDSTTKSSQNSRTRLLWSSKIFEFLLLQSKIWKCIFLTWFLFLFVLVLPLMTKARSLKWKWKSLKLKW